jgi:hypothetical protein
VSDAERAAHASTYAERVRWTPGTTAAVDAKAVLDAFTPYAIDQQVVKRHAKE